jgi:hypothetical protein
MSALKSPTEADILEGVVRPDSAGMSLEAARALLQLSFDAPAKKAVSKLLRENSKGTISAEDRLLLDRYLRVGQLIDLVQAKARLSLSQSKA